MAGRTFLVCGVGRAGSRVRERARAPFLVIYILCAAAGIFELSGVLFWMARSGAGIGECI